MMECGTMREGGVEDFAVWSTVINARCGSPPGVEPGGAVVPGEPGS